MPLAIVDARIIDLAQAFWSNPDSSLSLGYRRLEDILRNRLNVKDSGKALFGRAFQNEPSALTWKGCNESEHQGRGNLFSATTEAYRNPRAHREPNHNEEEAHAEFLLLNQLFRMEAEAIENVIEAKK
jgi:hypothetical protein